MTLRQKISETMTAQGITAYALCKQLEISHHESDLYLKQTNVSNKLVENYEFKNNVKRFTSRIDGTMWYDIPFAYDPFWNKVK